MENQNLIPVDYSNQRVMTSAQLADALSDRDDNGNITKAVTVENIRRNFNRNRDQFVKGRDYFQLTGDELKRFGKICPEAVNKFSPVLTLWTEWGAMLHAKMVNTDTAWKNYQALVQFYFHCRDAVVVPPPFDLQTIQAAFRDIINAAVQDANAQIVVTSVATPSPFDKLPPFELNGYRVLMTMHLAAVFGCTMHNIQQNFVRHREQFVEGQDYFQLTGDELKKFREHYGVYNQGVTMHAACLNLWTKTGVYKHAQMINTTNALEMYGKLVQYFFHYRELVAQPVNLQTMQAAILQLTDTVNTLAGKISAFIDTQVNTCRVYVARIDEETVKIGYSGRASDRFDNLEDHNDLTINGAPHVTPRMSREDARQLEKLAHRHFRFKKDHGEYFKVDYKDACDYVNLLYAKMSSGEPLVKFPELTEAQPDKITSFLDENAPPKKTSREIRIANSYAHRAYSPYPNLVAEIIAHQLLYNEVARLLGMASGDFSRKIRGEREFTVDEKIKLVEIFQKPIEWLLWREDKNTAEQKNASTNDDTNVK